MFTFGEITFTLKKFSKILGFFGEFLFCCWGGLGTLWVGGPRRGFSNFFSKYLS